MPRFLLLAIPLLLCRPSVVGAQCADGTLPPCPAARRPASPAHAPPSPEARARRFLLLPFRNVTRGADQDWLVTGAPLMLGEALGQYRDLNVVPEERVTAARRRLALPSDSALDAAQLKRLSAETDGWTAVTGNIFATGARVRITVQALDVPTERVLVRGETEVANDADVREAFNRLSVRLLEAPGVRAAGSEVAALTTQSVDAYRAYVNGVSLRQRSKFRQAHASFAEAVRLDSTFALAWAKYAITSLDANPFSLFDPASPVYRGIRQAARFASRLPDRQAQLIRAMLAFFDGRFARARQMADSLTATDPDDLDALEFLASIEIMDPALDTSTNPPRPAASLNRGVMIAREVLERDPGRRNVYSVVALGYGVAGGLLNGERLTIREGGSIIAMLTRGPELSFVPVLRDSIVFLLDSDFDRLPQAERAALRRRSADAAMDWVERWLAAGPEDADAHLWASRIAEVRDDWPRAFREMGVADSLGVQTSLEDIRARRLMLLVRTGRYALAAALADSLDRAGLLQSSPIPTVSGPGYGAAAFLLTRQWARVAAIVDRMGPTSTGASPCVNVLNELTRSRLEWFPAPDLRAMADTAAYHFSEIAAFPSLAPCLGNLTISFNPDSTSGRRGPAAAALLRAADSLHRAGNETIAFRAAGAAWRTDTASRRAVAEREWFMARLRTLAFATRFAPGVAFVSGDSAVFSFRLAGTDSLELSHPTIVWNWTFGIDLPAPPGADTNTITIRLRHSWRQTDGAKFGGVPQLIAFMSTQQVTVSPSMPPVRPAVSATPDGFRVVIRGPVVAEIRRVHPVNALFFADPCMTVTDGLCGRPRIPIEYH